MPNKKRRRPIPLAAPNRPMTSRKRARHVTTMFHKLTTERDLALKQGDTTKVKSCEKDLEEMGGRSEYQRASQLSTSFHSTSKWVLGHLANSGWLYGIKTADAPVQDGQKRKRNPRRTTRILEVGAINTELLDAAGMVAAKSRERKAEKTEGDLSSTTRTNQPKNNIHVRAIDIHSMEERIEESDFLELPLDNPDDPSQTIRRDCVFHGPKLCHNARRQGQNASTALPSATPGRPLLFYNPQVLRDKIGLFDSRTLQENVGKGWRGVYRKIDERKSSACLFHSGTAHGRQGRRRTEATSIGSNFYQREDSQQGKEVSKSVFCCTESRTHFQNLTFKLCYSQ